MLNRYTIRNTPALIVLVVLGQVLAGCNDTPSLVGPSDPPPPGETVVRGEVRDTALKPLAGAVVQILDGPQAGRSATADGQGRFSLRGTVDDTTQFRATRFGYAAATARSTCNGCTERQVTFELAVVAPTVNVAGNYTLTFVADSACTALPSDMRMRTYAVTIAATGNDASYDLAVSGASINDLGYPPIGVSGDVVQFAFVDDHNVPYLVEQVAPNARLEITGYAEASIESSGLSTISTSFDGWIDYIGPQIVRCGKSTHHRLILTRR